MSECATIPWEELVKSLLGPMVEHDEIVGVDVKEASAGGLAIRATVHPDDTGQVIGRGGSTVSALRTLVEFAARRADRAVTFDIADG